MVQSYRYEYTLKNKRLVQIAIGNGKCIWVQLRCKLSFKDMFKKGLAHQHEVDFSYNKRNGLIVI